MPRLGRMRASGCADRSGDGIRAPAVGGAGPWTSATARTPTGERRASSGPGVGTSDPEITSHDVRDAMSESVSSRIARARVVAVDVASAARTAPATLDRGSP